MIDMASSGITEEIYIKQGIKVHDFAERTNGYLQAF